MTLFNISDILNNKKKVSVLTLFVVGLYIFLSMALYFPIFHTCLQSDFYYIANQTTTPSPTEECINEMITSSEVFGYNYCSACKWLADSKTDIQPNVCYTSISIALLNKTAVSHLPFILNPKYTFLLRAPPAV